MKKQILLLLVFIAACLGNLRAETIYTEKDSTIFESYIKKLSPIKDSPIDKVMLETAKYFIDSPYQESTLESGSEEALIINLREFDCTTFVETCIALSLTLKSEEPSFTTFCSNLTKIRYRDGIIDKYPSRLHYMTDWIYENQKNGILQDITTSIGGSLHTKTIDFMSTHPASYKHLTDNAENLSAIKTIEEDISRRNAYSYLSKKMILLKERFINNGNIILFSTSIDGLDYTHLGIAYREKSEMHFIHASSRSKKVVIEPKTLQNYCLTSTTCNGISVLQLKN